MTTITKKVCLIGDFSVGKTSLFRRFINNTFSEQYITTVGVKVDTRLIELSDELHIKLILWDIAGADKMSVIGINYLRGAHGYILVADGTRQSTLHSVLALKAEVDALLNKPPYIGLLNKSDLMDAWEVEETFLGENVDWRKSSALTGEGVEEAFNNLAMQLSQGD